MGEKNRSKPAAGKTKRRRVWGIILITLGALMTAEGLVLGIVLREIALLLCMGIEGLIVLGIGILLRHLSKRTVDVAGEYEANEQTAAPVQEEKPEEIKYMLKDIIDEKTRKEIYYYLDGLLSEKENSFESLILPVLKESTEELRFIKLLFFYPDTHEPQSVLMETADFLEKTAKYKSKTKYIDACNRGAKAIRDFFAENSNC